MCVLVECEELIEKKKKIKLFVTNELDVEYN